MTVVIFSLLPEWVQQTYHADCSGQGANMKTAHAKAGVADIDGRTILRAVAVAAPAGAVLPRQKLPPSMLRCLRLLRPSTAGECRIDPVWPAKPPFAEVREEL